MYVSETGQVRATVEELLNVNFVHFLSGLDTEVGDPAMGCGRPTIISGFTEWVGQSLLPISFGWDWHLEVTRDTVCLIRTDCPRTNVQLTNSDGQDCAWEENLQILGTIVDALPWVVSVETHFWHQAKGPPASE
jgi:Domain of unknown function (DUF4902)